MRIALRVVPFAWIRGWIDRTARPPAPLHDGWPLAVRRAVQRAARTFPGSRCLARALAAEKLLREGGHETTLTIGVAKGDPGSPPLDAHAWVESRGFVVAGDGELERYATLVRFESGA